jgi:hypothetical protein
MLNDQPIFAGIDVAGRQQRPEDQARGERAGRQLARLLARREFVRIGH